MDKILLEAITYSLVVYIGGFGVQVILHNSSTGTFSYVLKSHRIISVLYNIIKRTKEKKKLKDNTCTTCVCERTKEDNNSSTWRIFMRESPRYLFKLLYYSINNCRGPLCTHLCVVEHTTLMCIKYNTYVCMCKTYQALVCRECVQHTCIVDVYRDLPL